jgi:hypothetical protein
MATKTILQLTQAVGGLTGFEQLEAAQPTSLPNGQPGWASIRVTSAQIAALAATILNPTGVASASPTVGESDNYSVGGEMGPTIGFLELTPAGICNITGLIAGFDGQVVVITNLSTFNMTLNALNSGSLSANQFRMVSDFTLIQNDSKSFKYSATIGKWIALEF